MPLTTRPMTQDDLYAAMRLLSGGGPPTDWDTLLYYEHRTLGSESFNEAAPVTLLASAVNQVVVTFALPAGRVGICRAFACGVVNLVDYDNIVWRLRVNGNPVMGWDNIRGPISTFLFPVPVTVPLQKNATVDIVASNLTALPILQVTALVRGIHMAPLTHAGGPEP